MKYGVLIADSDADLLSVFELMLEDDFNLSLALDGKTAMEAIEATAFHVVIIDGDFSEKDKHALCECIKAIPALKRPGVMMLSTDMSDDAIRRAYACGVDDYIEKPFNVVGFHQRLMHITRDVAKIRALQEDDNRKRSLAETAMKQSSAYGFGLELLAKLNMCHSVEEFMQRLTAGLLTKGYTTAVELRHNEQRFYFDVDRKRCSSNEIKVFELLHGKGRIYSFGKRTIFNETNVSLLIKNMPTEGTMSYDSAIDLFAKLVPALGSRFVALMQLKAMQETDTSLQHSIALVSDAIRKMEVDRKARLEEIATAISLSFHELDMTEKQEAFFLDLLENKLGKIMSSEEMAEALELLQSCAEKLAGHMEKEAEQTLPESDFSDDDIELF